MRNGTLRAIELLEEPLEQRCSYCQGSMDRVPGHEAAILRVGEYHVRIAFCPSLERPGLLVRGPEYRDGDRWTETPIGNEALLATGLRNGLAWWMPVIREVTRQRGAGLGEHERHLASVAIREAHADGARAPEQLVAAVLRALPAPPTR